MTHADSEARKSTAALRLGVIRVVVVAADRADWRSEDGPPPVAVETTAGLARLGDPVELIRADSAASLAACCTDGSVDLVLLDRLGETRTAGLLAALPVQAPPTVVVVGEGEEDEALAAFRVGAADCIAFGPDYEAVLPVVLLEQVRRSRSARRQRAAEDRIRWLEDLYAAVVTEMPAALAVLDADGLVVAANPEFDLLFPSRGEAIPTSASGGASEFVEARVPAELVEAIERGARTIDGGAHHSIELVRVEAGGAEARAYEVRQRRLGDAGRMLLLVSDVTESEWLSERLDALRRDTRDIIENVNSALIVVGPDGRISFANPAAERILGSPGIELVGRAIGDWFAAPASGALEETNPIERCLADGTRSRGAETMLQRGDGHWIPVGVSCSPRLDADGRSRGVVAVFQDLSEIKELEQQVRQTEKMASIGQLAAGLAHEVNNPMGFIHANLRQMVEYLADLNRVLDAMTRLVEAAGTEDREALRAAAADVGAISKEIDLDYVRTDFEKALLESGEGAERIRHIVKDLRDFSRADPPERTPSDVNQALDSTANIVHTMMKHTVVLEKHYAELPEIDAYPMQLKQVFMNLLVNAQQAIEARGDREPGVIRLETAHEGDQIVVRISDTGVGIAEADRTRIFEPFFTTKPVGAGTGLGLSTSFAIIERHGGRITVESEPGRGSTFEVRLPVSPSTSADAASVRADDADARTEA
ncbi:MAG: PAS domain-containing protein [Spirochaetaceae bacterium]|nr:PAS domain-containing protein [Spirochaetaceae bacterium]